jgi:hypothetical protein
MRAGWCTRLWVLAGAYREWRQTGVTLSGLRMKFTLANESLLPDLLSFLRKEGCVAYYEDGGIEAVRPHSFGEQEAAELCRVMDSWCDEHPEARIEMLE